VHDGGRFENSVLIAKWGWKRYCLGLLQAYRQLDCETALLPYTSNDFVFENLWVVRRFVKMLRPIQKRGFRRIVIRSPNDNANFRGEYLVVGRKLVYKSLVIPNLTKVILKLNSEPSGCSSKAS